MIWIRLDTEKAEILGADEHPAHGEWIEWGEARRIIREHNELAARSEIGPGHDPTGEGSAYQPPTCQGEGHAKSAGPLQFPRVASWLRSFLGGRPPNLPGSGPQLREAVQAIQGRAENAATPEPWNEESSKGILALVNERDRLRDQVSRLQEERDAAVGRAVLAERVAARLRAVLDEIAGISANENTDPDGMADALAMIQGTVRRATAKEGAKP